MSKKSKKAAKDRNRAAKRAKRMANKAMFQERALKGENTKSKRAIKKAKRKRFKTISHPEGPCGNIGCSKCFPQYNTKRKGRPALYGSTKTN